MSDLDAAEADTRDQCEAFALLDNAVVREQSWCFLCNTDACRHLCHFCRTSKPCPCDEGGEISDRESRDLAAKHAGGPARRMRP
jgi:hypothetical protein